MMGLDLQADHGRVTLRAVPLPLRQQNLQKLIPELLGYLAEHQEMSPAVLATWLARRLGSEHEQWNTSQAIQLLTDVERLCPQLVKSPPSGLYNPLIYRLHWRPSSMTETEMTPRPRLFSSWGRPPPGKTALAIALRERLPVELISVDSALIYRGMDIGTAAERRRIGAGAASADRYSRSRRSLLGRGVPRRRAEGDGRHHRRRAHSAAGRRHHVVFQGVVGRIVAAAVRRSAVRERIERQAAEQGWEALHRQLQAIDPVAALRIHPNDPQRLSRALEVFISGKTLTELTKISGESLPYQVHQFAIAPTSRELIHQRIELRYHQMLAAGFETEARALFARGDLHTDLPSIRCVGYRQMWSYLSGEISYDEMVYRGICATRQLAKRQMTWLRVGSRSIGWTVKSRERLWTR